MVKGVPGMATTRLLELVNRLAEPFVGRWEEALVLVMAVVSKEHAILIGEPGTGKSALARRLATLLDARFFKYLLTKFTEPGELLGPLDIKALREGVYRRITRDKMPEAEIVFLDEVFNANSAVLNSLLSVMQERVIYDGYTEIKTSIWSIIGASNQTPTEPELEALYDRFMLRHLVKPLDAEYWSDLIYKSWEIEKRGYEAEKPIISLRELRQWYDKLLGVDISQVLDKMLKLFMVFEEKGIHLTDRRKGKAAKIVAAHALIHGRSRAELTDLHALKYVVPRDIDEFEKAKTILFEEIKTREKVLAELAEIKANLERIAPEIRRSGTLSPRLIDYYKVLRELENKVKALASDMADEEVVAAASELLDVISDLLEIVTIKLNM